MLRDCDYKIFVEKKLSSFTITIYAVQQYFSSSKLLNCFCKLKSANRSTFSTSIYLLRKQANLVKINK